MLSTQNLGGVKVTEEQLREMQVGDYILHARGGELQKVQVEKTWLPVDPEGHVQCQSLAQGPDGTIYAAQRPPLPIRDLVPEMAVGERPGRGRDGKWDGWTRMRGEA